ncbi:leucine-rich repeat-containing protein 15-like [Mytilus edulis]|uniref:leucine-rich repeat-containing protein 15-like n=1 Tax=Mytilus edulis TaxID=6550 RepID=UPI0039F0DF8C
MCYSQFIKLHNNLDFSKIDISPRYLNSNQITTIQPGAFQDLPALYKLYLYNNQITTIQPGAFQDLPALYDLYLFNNQITTIQPGAFQDLPALYELQLANNQIHTIQQGIFQDLPALNSLYLYNNQITTIQKGAFKDLLALDRLELNNNQITTIQEGTFQDLPALNTLKLGNNPLDCDACELGNLKLYLLNNTQLSDASATCNGTSTLVLDFNSTDCSGDLTTDDTTEINTAKFKTVASTKSTLIIVGAVGAFIAVMILVGAVIITCVILNRLNRKKKSRIQPSD